MTATIIITLATAIFLMAILYSSVGHAGAQSGYLAAMAIVTQMPQEEMKAIALTLNIFVQRHWQLAFRSSRALRLGHILAISRFQPSRWLSLEDSGNFLRTSSSR